MARASAVHDLATWGDMPCRIVVARPEALPEAAAILTELLAAVDETASRFRDDAEIRRLRPGAQEVSPLLAELVRVALDVAERTEGAVDPTVGGALLGIGYDADLAVVRERGTSPVQVRRVPGWRSVGLAGRTLTLAPGTLLDLGATAKAHTADLVAARVAQQCDTGVLVCLGGDLATAGPAPQGGWQVTVRDLVCDPAQQVGLSAGAALATSSAARRRWRTADGVMHHVVDPATGLPGRTGWRSASVVAPTCAEANALATALLARESALALLHRSGRPARLVDHDGRVRTVAGWPTEVAA